MAANANIFFEREGWKGPLGWSAGLHGAFFLVIVAYSIFGNRGGASWGSGEIGSAMGATLVSQAAVPLTANPVRTNNIVANESAGLSQSLPKAVEEAPEANPIPDRPKPKPQPRTSLPVRPVPTLPEDNVLPHGDGGPVSGLDI